MGLQEQLLLLPSRSQFLQQFDFVRRGGWGPALHGPGDGYRSGHDRHGLNAAAPGHRQVLLAYAKKTL